MSKLQHEREVLVSKDAVKTRRKIFKSTLAGQDVNEDIIGKRVLGLLQSDDKIKVMAGFDLLQCCRSNDEAYGVRMAWPLLKIHSGQIFSDKRQEFENATHEAIDKLSGNIDALSLILARSHVDMWIGDGGFRGVTECGEYALTVLSGRVDEVHDKTALAYIACYSSNETDRLAAVEKLGDSESLHYVVLNSAPPTSLRALEKLAGDEKALVKVAIEIGRNNLHDITEEGKAAIDLLAGNLKGLEAVATYARGRQGELAAAKFKNDFFALQRIAVNTPWRGQSLSPVHGEPRRHDYALQMLVESGSVEEWGLVVKEAVRASTTPHCGFGISNLPQTHALKKLEAVVDTITDRGALNVIVQHSEDERAKQAAMQKLSETSVLGKLKRRFASS